eukprot:2152083-Rhodomonas_salina.1
MHAASSSASHRQARGERGGKGRGEGEGAREEEGGRERERVSERERFIREISLRHGTTRAWERARV